MVAYTMANANANIPKEVCDALQDAMEIAIANVPANRRTCLCLPGCLGVDVVARDRLPQGRNDIGALRRHCGAGFGRSARKNPSAEVLPFEQNVVKVDLNARDSVMTNASRLASVGGGGTTEARLWRC